jgi:hypothetical protein
MAQAIKISGTRMAASDMLWLAMIYPFHARALGGDSAVDAEIVFAVDISYSMDRVEQELQRDGYVQALTSPEFLNALKSNAMGRIAITYIQWASYSDQDVVLGWTLIDSPESAAAAAAKLKAAPFRRAQRTSISGAIDAATKMFDGNGFNGARQIIDISGDGPNNNGRFVALARDEALARGITINGLPLVGIRSWIGPADIRDLDIYYEDCVIGGPDAFMITIRDTRSFVEATRTKLVREIASVPKIQDKTETVIPAASREPRISCTIGETLWRGRWGN